jgi:hypothetical protein
MSTLETAGYIVHDNEGIVHGYGPTADEAWHDMMITMQNANIELLEDDEDSTERDGSWLRLSWLKTAPATAAMLALVKADGGACTWGRRNGVACTRDEEEAA